MPAGAVEGPAIHIDFYEWGQEETLLGEKLEGLGDQSRGSPGKRKNEVLLLGRYNFLRPKSLSELQSRYPSLSIRFMTMHRSKGLEADHVIILGARVGRLGMPSEIVDDPLLDLVLPEPEDLEHAEERRLFYVALTRAKRSVTILASAERPSAFVRELINDEAYEVSASETRRNRAHICLKCKGQMLEIRAQTGDAKFVCEHIHLCGEVLPACSECNVELPRLDPKNHAFTVCACGAWYQTCPNCREGWLEEKSGKFGNFLGCVRFPECKHTKSIPNKI